MNDYLTSFLDFVAQRRIPLPELQKPENEMIIGGIGTGKTYWVLYKMIKFMEMGIPFCYIDPKGEGYWLFLAILSLTREGRKLWETIRHKVLFLNPVSKSDYLLGFNAIETIEGEFSQANPDRIALVANNLTSHIRRGSGFEANEAMRMQNFLAAGIATLVQGGRGDYTIAEFPYLFKPQYKDGEKGYRDYNAFTEMLRPNVTHYGTRFFWDTGWPTMLPNERRIYVQSSNVRIFPYVFDERCLWTTCTTKNARLNFREVVEKGYWLFVNLPYYFEDDPVTTLLGNIIITKLYYAAMQRPNPMDYHLILDEARFFSTGPLDRLLETGRFKKLWTKLIVQSMGQLARSREGRLDYYLLKTASQCVRYWSVFQDTEREDVEYLSWLMYRTTGSVPQLTADGRVSSLPVSAEQNAYQRKFVELPHRNVILFDKQGSFRRDTWWTPDVPSVQFEQEELNMFEADHLMRTGVPAREIKREIEERHARLDAMWEEEKPKKPQSTHRSFPKPSQMRRPQ